MPERDVLEEWASLTGKAGVVPGEYIVFGSTAVAEIRRLREELIQETATKNYHKLPSVGWKYEMTLDELETAYTQLREENERLRAENTEWANHYVQRGMMLVRAIWNVTRVPLGYCGRALLGIVCIMYVGIAAIGVEADADVVELTIIPLLLYALLVGVITSFLIALAVSSLLAMFGAMMAFIAFVQREYKRLKLRKGNDA